MTTLAASCLNQRRWSCKMMMKAAFMKTVHFNQIREGFSEMYFNGTNDNVILILQEN